MLLALLSQVDEGDQEIINIRETSSLGPLLYGLIALGILTLLGTAIFWWLTRPERTTTETTAVTETTDLTPPELPTPPPIPRGTDG